MDIFNIAALPIFSRYSRHLKPFSDSHSTSLWFSGTLYPPFPPFVQSTNFLCGNSISGVVFAGNPVTQSFSIGGLPPQTVLEQLTSILLGRLRGLIRSHNSYESDSSTTRGDSYLLNGDFSTLRVEYLQDILDRSGVDNYAPRHMD